MNTEPNPYASPISSDVGPETSAGLRPNSPLVIGILAIVFGSIGLLMGVWGLIYLWLSSSTALGSPSALTTDELYGPGYSVTMSVVGFATSIAELFAGIGLVRYRHWGRSLFLLYAIAKIVVTVGNAAYMVFFALPNMPIDNAFFKASMYGGAIGGVLFGCLFPVIGLVFLLQRRVVAWLS